MSEFLRQLIPDDSMHLRNIIALWLAVYGVSALLLATYRLHKKPNIAKSFSRRVAVVDLAGVVRNLNGGSKTKVLAFLEQDSAFKEFFPRIKAAADGDGATAFSYFDDYKDDPGFSSGQSSEESPIEKRLQFAEARLWQSDQEFFSKIVYNRCRERFAVDQANPDSPSKVQFQGKEFTQTHQPTEVVNCARDYLKDADFLGAIVRSTDKVKVEKDLLKAVTEPEERLSIIEAILRHKHVVQFLVLENQEAYPVDRTAVTFKPFPVWATFAGPLKSGFFHGGELAFNRERWEVDTLYPKEPRYFVIASRSDSLWIDNSVVVEPAAFQSAVQLVRGGWPFIFASVVAFTAALIAFCRKMGWIG